MFSGNCVSDEVYYVSGAKFLLYKLGLVPVFSPPIKTSIETISGTVVISVSEAGNSMLNILTTYDWRNLEHPALAKLLIGALLLASSGSLVVARLVVLFFSLLAFFVLSFAVLKLRGWAGAVALGVFLLFDWTAVHFTYLLVLDTFMLMFLMLSTALFLDGRKWRSLAFLSLSVACKEVGLLASLAFAIYLYLRGRERDALLFFLVPVLALGASYSVNFLVASPHDVLKALSGLGVVEDPFACKLACFLGLRIAWGPFLFYPFFIWVWFAGMLVRIAEGREDSTLLPYFIGFLFIAGTVVISLARSVYVYYYAPVVLLSVFPLSDVVTYLKKARNRKGARNESRKA